MRIKYNSPVVLTFALLSTIVLLFSGGTPTDGTAPGELIKAFTVFPSFDFSNPLDYFRLFSHTLGHGDWQHLIGNMSLILVIGPILEEKYGSKLLIVMMIFTAFTTGVLNILLSDHALLGASGIVFMMITLSSFGSFKKGDIPLTFILVAILYIGKEIMQSFEEDNISQMGHIIGGLCGGLLGFLTSKNAEKLEEAQHTTPEVDETPKDQYL